MQLSRIQHCATLSSCVTGERSITPVQGPPSPQPSVPGLEPIGEQALAHHNPLSASLLAPLAAIHPRAQVCKRKEQPVRVAEHIGQATSVCIRRFPMLSSERVTVSTCHSVSDILCKGKKNVPVRNTCPESSHQCHLCEPSWQGGQGITARVRVSTCAFEGAQQIGAVYHIQGLINTALHKA
jgi:hypothetical protein